MPKPIANTAKTTASIVRFFISDALVSTITLRLASSRPKPAIVASTTWSTPQRLTLPSATFRLVVSMSLRIPGSSPPSLPTISSLVLSLRNSAGSTRDKSGFLAMWILRWVSSSPSCPCAAAMSSSYIGFT